ncbi:hypothetical protein AC579_1586 [Pseudocercospora musae]|uniref:DUF4185 domain-containing protein n=1 Tax=Pseudocercospora musae TaxID=113226 RepID=A0A139HMH7_9PEZI|nr:hypothetical protein AC579_1586 [Pseudocercospora musae]
MLKLLLPAALAVQVFAAPTEPIARRAVTPVFKSATVLGNLTDPTKDRDSCGSTRIGSRAFWTCRDTMAWANNADVLPVYANTAAWTTGGATVSTKNNAVGAGSTGSNPILPMNGPLREYFPLQSGMCSGNHGFCTDGTRWANWPNTPPLMTSASSTKAIGYSWIAKSHLSGLSLVNTNPPYTLYKTTYTGTNNAATQPVATVVNAAFWTAGQPGYGDYGNVVRNGYAYLYAKTIEGQGPALARVPVGSVELKSRYQYWVNGQWTSTMPASLSDPTIVLPGAGDGWQGTYYWSSYYNSMIWIGQRAQRPVAWFYISTAPAPEGPWTDMSLLWKGQDGDGFVGAYSLQAHPALLPSNNAAENAIYLSYTQVWNPATYPAFTMPLVYLQFQ